MTMGRSSGLKGEQTMQMSGHESHELLAMGAFEKLGRSSYREIVARAAVVECGKEESLQVHDPEG